jgi:acyl carrier protein
MSPTEDRRARVVRVMGQVMGVAADRIGGDASPRTVPGWDSMKHVSLMLALEEEFGVQFSDERMMDLISLPLILDELDRLQPPGTGHAQS